MAATTHSAEDEAGQPESGAAAQPVSAPPGSLLMGSTGHRCAVCSAEMAPDQHYCVECGARRGSPRFTLTTSSASVPTSVSGVSVAVAGAWTRTTVLLATLVVLVALALGVLIGSSGSSISQPLKLQINGGGLVSAGGATAGSGTKTSASTGKTKKAVPPKVGTTTNFFGTGS